MAGQPSPNVYIVAGPNGAGKSSFARLFLPEYADCLDRSALRIERREARGDQVGVDELPSLC